MRVDAAFIDLMKQYFVPRKGTAAVGGNLVPAETQMYNLGAPDKKFGVIYARQIVADSLSGSTTTDTVDGFHAYPAPQPNALLALNATGIFPVEVYPEALLLDGSRTLVGNLTVANGVTVDGVDISVHAANGNIHHANGMGQDDHSQYVHTAIDRTVSANITFTGTPTFNIVGAPFVLGASARGVTVTGLKADQLNKSVSSGFGLTGGGALTADQTLAVDIGTFLVPDGNKVGVQRGTAQYQVVVSGPGPNFEPQYVALSTYAGSGLSWSANSDFAVNTGLGIGITNDALEIKLQGPSGLVVTASGLAVDDTIAGNGIQIVNKVLSIQPGSMITVLADGVAMSSGTQQWQTVVTGPGPGYYPQYASLPDMAGDGLAFSNGIFSVNVGDGLDILVDVITVDVTDFIDTASGLRETNNDIQVNIGAGLTFSSGAIILDYSGGTPVALTPDLAGAAGTSLYAARADHAHAIAAAAPGTIQPDDTASEGSSTSFARADHRHAIVAAAPGANSVNLGASTEGTGTSFARADHTHQLDVSITPVWTGAHTFRGQVTARHILPELTDTYDLGSSTTLWRKGWLSELDAVLFAQNTVTLLGGWFMVTKGEGSIEQDVTAGQTQIDFGPGAGSFAANDFILFRAAGKVEYMQLVSVVSGTTWNVTRDLDGSGANDWPKGSVYANIGYNGSGRIELNAYDTPRISLIAQGSAYNAQAEKIRIGDLNAGWGYVSSTYGIGIGGYQDGVVNFTWDDTNGIRIRLYQTVVGQWDNTGAITLGDTAAGQPNTKITGTYLALRSGAVERIKLNEDTSGFIGSHITWDANGNVTITGADLTITDGGFNLTTAASGARVSLTSAGLKAFNSTGTEVIGINTDGSMSVAGGQFAVSTTGSVTITNADLTITDGGFSLMTAASGARVAADSTGIKTYNSAGNNVIALNTDGSMSVAGGQFSVSTTGAVAITGADLTITDGGFDLSTAASAARVALTINGLKAYNDSSTNTISINTDGSVSVASGQFAVSTTGNVTITNANLSITNGGFTLKTADSGARLELLTTGLVAYNASGVQRVNISNDGSGWFGSSTAFAWTNAGAVTINSATIGGWTVNSDRIAKDTGTGSSSSGMAPVDYPFYAGQVYASRASAPFRVNAAGALYATGATVSGSLTATSGTFSGTVNITGGGKLVAGPTTLSPDGIQIGIVQAMDASHAYTFELNGVEVGGLYSYASSSFFGLELRKLGSNEGLNYLALSSDIPAGGAYTYVMLSAGSVRATLTGNADMTGNFTSDVQGIFQKSYIGDSPAYGADYACFMNNDNGPSTGGTYALLVGNSTVGKHTYLNAPTGANIYARINNTNQMIISAGEVQLETHLELKELSAPSAPPSGYGRIYQSSSGNLMCKNDSGYDLPAVYARIPLNIFGGYYGGVTEYSVGGSYAWRSLKYRNGAYYDYVELPIVIPDGWGGKAMTLNLFWYTASTSTGNCYWYAEYARMVHGTNVQNQAGTAAVLTDAGPGSANVLQEHNITFTPSGVADGDLLVLRIVRGAAQAADTLEADVYLQGATLSLVG